MDVLRLIPYINAENELAVNVVSLAERYAYEGGDGLFIYNYSKDEGSREELLSIAARTAEQVDIPLILGIYAERFEDIKKALYTGASQIVVKQEQLKEEVLREGVLRFGGGKILVEIDAGGDFSNAACTDSLKQMGVCGIILKHVSISERLKENLKKSSLPVIIRDSLVRNELQELMKLKGVTGTSTCYFETKDLMKGKLGLRAEGIKVEVFESSIPFCELKQNSENLVPVVVQDYKTSEVLMVAYMNEEAFHKTMETGKMTYYSRSRKELWCKGDTSGHVQYVKALLIDCDCDTILAKVRQVGSACHTGAHSCFYTEIMKREYSDSNPSAVLNEVYKVIMDRKQNPKEGSYTNYLFDKGIDKILKKCGEEATEIVIAAKNPDAAELKYEISDFLYHLMVLMAEKNVGWDEVMKELNHRR